MRAVFASAFTSTTGTLAGQSLKANSLNDSGSGLTQILPLGLDQWAAQYQKYIVLGSKITLRASPTAYNGPAVVGIHLADNTTLLTTTSHYKSLPLTKQLIMTANKDYGRITMTYSGKKF